MVARAIQSIKQQSVSIDEIIVVDDGSTDSTADVAARAGSGVTVIRQENRGPSAARNAGLRVANSDIVAFLDSDDFWMPDKIRRQLQCLDENQSASGVVTGFEKRYENKSAPTIHLPGDNKLVSLSPVDFVVFSRASPSTLLINRKITGDVMFPEGVIEGEDPIFFGLIRSRGLVRSVDSILSVRNMHEVQLTKRPGSYSRSLCNRLLWLREYWRELRLESAAEAERLFWSAAKEEVMARYWARDLSGYKQARIELREVWPKNCVVPFNLKRLYFPDWVYGAKDLFDSSVLQRVLAKRSHDQ
jgi:glycosyltransferase involved in cell wall biosynthesis